MLHLFHLEASLLTSLRRILQPPAAPTMYETCEATEHAGIGDQWHLQLCLKNGDRAEISDEVCGGHRCAPLIAVVDSSQDLGSSQLKYKQLNNANTNTQWHPMTPGITSLAAIYRVHSRARHKASLQLSPQCFFSRFTPPQPETRKRLQSNRHVKWRPAPRWILIVPRVTSPGTTKPSSNTSQP